MHPKELDIMANSVDPDQNAPSHESTLFAQICLFENLGSFKKYIWISFSDIHRSRNATGRMQSTHSKYSDTQTENKTKLGY